MCREYYKKAIVWCIPEQFENIVPSILSNTTFQQLQLWSLADGIKDKKGDRVFQKHGLKKKAMFGMGCYHIIYTVNCLLLELFLAVCFNFSFSLVFV